MRIRVAERTVFGDLLLQTKDADFYIEWRLHYGNNKSAQQLALTLVSAVVKDKKLKSSKGVSLERAKQRYLDSRLADKYKARILELPAVSAALGGRKPQIVWCS